MLLLLFFYLLITCVCLYSGFIFYRFIIKDQRSDKPIILFIITGLIAVTIVTQILELFIPVNLYTLIIIIGLLLVLALLKRNDFSSFLKFVINNIRSIPIVGLLLLIVLCLVIAMLNAGPTLIDDTNSYHIQMIKWIREYGTVPGLANLHERYGFNSSWFSAASLFGLPTEQFNLYTVLNGALSIWFCFYTIGKAFSSNEKSTTRINSAILLTLFFSFIVWGLIRGNAASANYDFITTLIVFILFTEIISTKNIESLSTEICIWSVYLFTVRIGNFPFLIPVIYLFITAIKKPNWRIVKIYSAIFALLVVPFLIRNVILTGYLFYPITFPDLFNVDWKVDRTTIEQLVYYIRYYNRVNIMTQPLNETASMSFPQWIIPWFRQLVYYDKVVIIISAIGFLGGIVLFLKKFRKLNTVVYLFLFAIIIQLIIWFFLAPDPRFVYGCLLSGIFIFSFLIFSLAQKISSSGIRFALSACILAISIVYIFQKTVRTKNNNNFIIPKNLPIPEYSEINAGKINYIIPAPLIPDGDTCCFGLKLPCLYKLNPNLKLRGETISKGFYVQKQ